jgi:hypothetical protein
MTATTDDAGDATRALIFALVALACGHMLSTLLRTIPAISLDLMAADFRVQPQALASFTSVCHFVLGASQFRSGRRRTSLVYGRSFAMRPLKPRIFYAT